MSTKPGFLYGGKGTGKSDPNALIPSKDFIRYVEAVEQAFPDDTPTDVLTRIRVQYYHGIAFEQLIPGAHAYDRVVIYVGNDVLVPRTLQGGKLDPTAMKHLTARADENGLGDNPSPYIVTEDGARIDVGHLFLGMDALLHPQTSVPYTDYDVPNIDPSSWVADLGLASVWMTQHSEEGSPPGDAPIQLQKANIAEYIKMSAPSEDLLGDADSFGATQQLQAIPGQKLSKALQAYYLGANGKAPGVKSRWKTFCSMNKFLYDYEQSGTSITAINWNSSLRSTLIKRVNRFNDLAGAGKFGAMWGSLFGPSRKSWIYTPKVVDWFLAFVAQGLKAELASTP